MGIFIYIILLILIIILAYLAVALYLYKKEIKLLTNQLKFINENPTNLKLTLSFSPKTILNLVDNINLNIVKKREAEIKLDKLDKNFKKSITSLSHDIRTPLTSASGYMQMLKNENLDLNKKVEYVNIISERLECVQSLLNQLFEFSVIESNELKLTSEPCNINNILCEVLSVFYNDFSLKNITPKVEIENNPFIINGDYKALERIFYNIINNALSHGYEDYLIKSFRENNIYKIIFKNKANYISDYDIDNLFERFYKADKCRSEKTTGLGLSIAKNLVNKLGGEISAFYDKNYLSIVIEFIKN